MDSSIEGLPATALVLITTVLSCTQWVHAAFSTGNANPKLLPVEELGVSTATVCWRKGNDVMAQDFRLVLTSYDDEPMTFDASGAVQSGEKACYAVEELQSGTQYMAGLTWRNSIYQQQYSDSNVTFSTAENPCHAFGCVSGNCQAATPERPEEVSCVCFLGYYGHRCEYHNPCVLDPCGEYPCSNTSTNTYHCICPNGREVDNKEKCDHIRPCESNPCGLNGICQDVSAYEYSCKCNVGYFGTHCERMDPCMQVNCHNGGKCVNETNVKFHCKCKPGYRGVFCDQIDPCYDGMNEGPCQNSGICKVAANERGFSCTCLAGFSGPLCEQSNPCDRRPCQNGGKCSKQDDQDHFLCQCPARFYGKFCQYEDFCNPNPCVHGKCITDGPSTYKCTCDDGWLGRNCEIKDKCKSDMPCKNNGECHMDVEQRTYNCECPKNSGYWGRNCEFFNECVNNPCQHNGECRNMTYSRNGHEEYTCTCTGNFVGKNCEFWDNCKTAGYCEYQGDCEFKEHNISICKCRTGYYGEKCENYNVCEINDPCKNGAICKPVGDNGYKCSCVGGYSGLNCELFDPCQNSPCQNDGICTPTDDVLGKYKCDCATPFYGERCERQNYCEKKGASICPEGYNCKNMTTMHFVCAPTSSKVLEGPCLTSYDCMHNGVCLKSGKCDCKSPYKGSRCHEIEPCKDPSVCSSNGECISRSDTSECRCKRGFYGAKCELHDPCLTRSCYNGGNCVELRRSSHQQAPTTTCHCQPGYKGDDCSVMNQECVTNECLNGGTCLQAVSSNFSPGKKERMEGGVSPLIAKSYLPSDNFICKCTEKYKGKRCETLRQCMGTVEKLENSKGIIEWKTTEMGQMALAACPFGSRAIPSIKQLEQGAGFAHRDCVLLEGIHDKEASWEAPNTSNCDPEPQSDVEASKTLDSVAVLVQKAKPWDHSPESLEYAATVLRNLVKRYIVRSNDMAMKYLDIVDSLLEIRDQLRFEAEVRYSTISRLLFDLKTFMNSFVTADLPNPTIFTRPNIKTIWVTYDVSEDKGRRASFRFAQSEFEMKLDSSVFKSRSNEDTHRVQIMVFEKDALFMSQRISAFGQIVVENEAAKSTVISVTIKDVDVKTVSSESIQISFKIPYDEKYSYHCAFWEPTNRKWETIGLVTEVYENNTVCKSSHLTSFTILKVNTGRMNGVAPPSVLPFVGCGIACIAYSLLAVTYAVVRSARRRVGPGVIVHLSVSLLLLNISMMFASVKDRIASVEVCGLVSVAMHYLICTSFMWYTVEALFRYATPSLEATPAVFYKCGITAWGLPLVICGLSVLMKMDLHTVSDTYCRVTPELEFTFYALLLVPSAVLMVAATVLYLLHIFRCGSSPSSNSASSGLMSSSVPSAPRPYHPPSTVTVASNGANSSLLHPGQSSQKTATSQTVFVLGTLLIFVFNWVLNQVLFPATDIHIFDFVFCFCNVIQSTLLFSTLCLLSDDARFAWNYFWSPSHQPAMHSSSNKNNTLSSVSKYKYDEPNSLLGDETDKMPINFGSPCHSPSVSPHTPSPYREEKYSNGAITKNPTYTNHDLNNGHNKYNNNSSLSDVRNNTLTNGGVIFGDTKEIKHAIACLNTQGSFGSSISSGLNRDTNSERLQRGDPYAASYPQAATIFREEPSPAFSNPDRESYV